MQDHRTRTRHKLIYYLKVLDRDTASGIGSVVDLTPEGMMLMTPEPVAPGREFRLNVLVSGDEDAAACLQVKAKSRWCRKSVNTDFYDAGFEFLDADPLKQAAIEKLIEALAFEAER